MDESLIRETSRAERAEGTLRSELAWQASRARRILLDIAARSGELGPYFEMIRSKTADRGEQMKLVIPREIADALERGDWSWIHAKDGGGFLPTLVSADGKFAKQVRLVAEEIPGDPAEIANAAAHAQTHAMLRQILEKLEVMDRKLDALLDGQRDAWVGQIIAGTKIFKTLAAEPGERSSANALLANAIQSLEEGRNVGIRALQTLTASKPKAPKLLAMEREEPSKTRADWLDARQEDITWIYGASRTLAAIHAAQGRPIAARTVMHDLGREFADLRGKWEEVLEYAAYSPERETFWREQVSALCAAREPERVALALSTSAGEFLELRDAFMARATSSTHARPEKE